MSTETQTTSGRSNFQRDFLASVVVFLVALPLCMGIAIASGVPVSAGLLSGIIGGLIVATIAGAPLQVSGPAAGLTVIVYGIVQEHGIEYLGIVVLLGGAIQFVAALIGLGQWFRAVSPAVIKGMLAGIGMLIFSSQCHVMVDDAPKGSGLANLASIPEAISKGLPMPASSTLEERRARTDQLKVFGQLHEQRELLFERVVEAEPSGAYGHPEVESTLPPELLDRHEELHAELIQRTDELLGAEVTVSDERREGIESAARHALSASEEAGRQLETGHWEQAVEAEKEATQALADLLTSLKSHDWAAKVGLLTILVLVGWQFLPWKKLKLVPGPLAAVVVATAFAAIVSAPVFYVEAPESLWAELHVPQMTILQHADWGSLLKASLVLAVVASAETLLCVTAVDQMHTGPRANYDRELLAQGVGNMCCGFVGALPMTGVIVRSAANVNAGGRTRWSAWMHGIWLLVFVTLLPWVLQLIPTACLAGVLVYTGYKLMHPQAVRDLWKYGAGEVFIYAATVIMIVTTDLLTGVLTGIALSALKLFYNFSHLKCDVTVDEQTRKAVLTLDGAATFVRLPLLAQTLETVPGDVELHPDFTRMTCIDHACLDLLMNWGKQHEASGGSVMIDWGSLHPAGGKSAGK
ncbi:MAG: SulP family inorganic anion transporter [Planctomycetota bacterium]|jgi:MFS superfamily sulfate permease-like transporter